MLQDIFQTEEYALCMSSGFFRFYAHMGVLHALEENDCLRVKACSGSSAGALVTGFLASGMNPKDMPEKVFQIKRANIWDVGLGIGLLKGKKFQKILENNFTCKYIEDCVIPYGCTAYDVLGCRTNCITTGHIATAVRASCTFPCLFQPVVIDNRLHIDGGVFDDSGMMALPSIPSSNLIVNVVCGRGRIASSVLPEKYKDARLLTLVLDNIPSVSPFNMEKDGPLAFNIARAATFRMLHNGHVQQLSHNHWCAYIDGSKIDLTIPLVPLTPREAVANNGHEKNSNNTGKYTNNGSNDSDNYNDKSGGSTRPPVISSQNTSQKSEVKIAKRPSFQFQEKNRGVQGKVAKVSSENFNGATTAVNSYSNGNSNGSSSSNGDNIMNDSNITRNNNPLINTNTNGNSSSSNNSINMSSNSISLPHPSDMNGFDDADDAQMDIDIYDTLGQSSPVSSPPEIEEIKGKNSKNVEKNKNKRNSMGVLLSSSTSTTVKGDKKQKIEKKVTKKRASTGTGGDDMRTKYSSRIDEKNFNMILKRVRKPSLKLRDEE